MTQPEMYSYTIGPEEAAPGFEMHVLSGPKGFLTATHHDEYQHVWRDGLVNGDPGLVRQGVMTEDQAEAYIGYPIPKSLARQPAVGLEHPVYTMDTAVFTVQEDETSQMTAFARSGMGVTPASLRLEHAGEPVYHVRGEVLERFLASRTEAATSVAGLVKALPEAAGLSYLNTRTPIR